MSSGDRKAFEKILADEERKAVHDAEQLEGNEVRHGYFGRVARGWQRHNKANQPKELKTMDTRTGEIFLGRPGESLEEMAVRLGKPAEDLQEIGKLPDTTCPKCKGRGAVPAGFQSKRFKPCECTEIPPTPAATPAKV